MEILTLIIAIIALVLAAVAIDRTRRALNSPPWDRLSKPPPTTTTNAPTIVESVSADNGLPAAPEVLAAIAAAVSMVCGPNARIAGVQPALAVAGGGVETAAHLWALEGRRALHATHRPR